MVKGYAGPDGIATALRCAQEDAAGVLDRLVADGLVEMAAGSFRLTADGKAVGHERIRADSAGWGVDNALAALDAFLVLDHRMKETVTAWQMREVDGAQAFNDHVDAAYDAEVLGRLAELHADASAWLAPLVAGLPRLAAYGERLEMAAAAAAAGDGRYVASPRVDSYHGIWFELHEDLILLAGRNRADEVTPVAPDGDRGRGASDGSRGPQGHRHGRVQRARRAHRSPARRAGGLTSLRRPAGWTSCRRSPRSLLALPDAWSRFAPT